jgi:hypothetical protein
MSTLQGVGPLRAASYEPGVCNIGPAEIARRRRAGHVSLAITVVLLAALVALGVPHWVRLLLILPAGASASGYLQAQLHFCAGFGSQGVFNFGDVGTIQTVADPQARARDRRRSMEIGLASLAIGVAVAVVAAFMPIG